MNAGVGQHQVRLETLVSDSHLLGLMIRCNAPRMSCMCVYSLDPVFVFHTSWGAIGLAYNILVK
jgi:hypothetical protein